ncbi:MAG: DNA-processing protein DprA [Nitrososphaerota archaeon]|nr:DNA-processing protein DprA [Nitrososphaerota archaeon]
METAFGEKISTITPNELLGRSLNDIEQKSSPEVLYVAGPMKVPLPRPRVAIVGSRQADAEALVDAESIAKALTREGVVIVSGLARGIDSAAHRAAINSQGKTIAVLGTPLDKVYPSENAELQADIIKNHLAISQYRIGSVVTRSNFVRRNRVMALVADASVIVQAGETSGSLSQGYEALRLGRPLFIWKSLFESSLKWPKEMAKYGAMMLSDPKELLENLPSNKAILEISH